MESRFGHDFSKVRIHNESKAVESARAVQARAYTVGQHVVWGENQFAPHSSRDRELLAHELTHTVQQADTVAESVAGGAVAPAWIKQSGIKTTRSALMRQKAGGDREGDKLKSPLFAGVEELEMASGGELAIGLGAGGEFVKRIQIALLADDPNALPEFGADGNYGEETRVAVERYQKRHGSGGAHGKTMLAADGVVGRETLALMDLLLHTSNPPDPVGQTSARGSLEFPGFISVAGPADPAAGFGKQSMTAAKQATAQGLTGPSGGPGVIPPVSTGVTENMGASSAAGIAEFTRPSQAIRDKTSVDKSSDVIRAEHPGHKSRAWMYPHKEGILYPFALSGGFKTGFNFFDPKSWDQFKLREEVSDPKVAAKSPGLETNDFSTFYVNEGITEENFVNLMLGRFITGVGPENFVFPLNGSVSNEMRESAIVQNALMRWYTENYEAVLSRSLIEAKPKLSEFGFLEQSSLLLEKNFGIVNIPQFVGSATVTIEFLVSDDLETRDDQLFVTIRNVTSATSGDIYKHFPLMGTSPSFPKDTTQPLLQQYTNISQIFQFTMRVDRKLARLMSDMPPEGLKSK